MKHLQQPNLMISVLRLLFYIVYLDTDIVLTSRIYYLSIILSFLFVISITFSNQYYNDWEYQKFNFVLWSIEMAKKW